MATCKVDNGIAKTSVTVCHKLCDNLLRVRLQCVSA